MRCLRTVLFSSILIATATIPVRANEQVYDRVVQSTVLIVTPGAIGSGTLIDVRQKLVVTAQHVIGQRETVLVYFADYDSDGRPITELEHYGKNARRLQIKGRVVGRLKRCDLALIQLDSLPKRAIALPLASVGARQGQEVHVLGNSSAQRGVIFNYSGGGSVRNVDNTKPMPGFPYEGRFLETGLAANQGDSGGPIVNARCELVAVVSCGTTAAAAASEKSIFHNEQVVVLGVDVSEVRNLIQSSGFTLTGSRPTYVARSQKPWEGPIVPSKSINPKLDIAYPLFPAATIRKPWESPLIPAKTHTLLGGAWKQEVHVNGKPNVGFAHRP